MNLRSRQSLKGKKMRKQFFTDMAIPYLEDMKLREDLSIEKVGCFW